MLKSILYCNIVYWHQLFKDATTVQRMTMAISTSIQYQHQHQHYVNLNASEEHMPHYPLFINCIDSHIINVEYSKINISIRYFKIDLSSWVIESLISVWYENTQKFSDFSAYSRIYSILNELVFRSQNFMKAVAFASPSRTRSWNVPRLFARFFEGFDDISVLLWQNTPKIHISRVLRHCIRGIIL